MTDEKDEAVKKLYHLDLVIINLLESFLLGLAPKNLSWVFANQSLLQQGIMLFDCCFNFFFNCNQSSNNFLRMRSSAPPRNKTPCGNIIAVVLILLFPFLEGVAGEA
jgi:hypothetical protein